MSQPRAPSSNITIVVGALLGASLIGLFATTNGAVAVALPLALAGGVVLFMWPVIGLLLFTAMIPVEASVMIGGRSLAALIGMAVFGIWASQKLLRREPLLPLLSPGLIQTELVLVAFACLSLTWAFYPAAGVRGIIVLSQLVLLTILVLDLASSWERIAWVAKLLVLAGTAAALLTAEQYFFGGVRRAGEGVTGGLNRTAMTLVTILPFAFYLLRSNGPVFWRFLGLFYIGASAVAVVTTLSRMSYLFFPVVAAINVAWMLRTSGERRGAVLLGAIALFMVAVMPMDALRQRAATIGPYLSQTVGTDESEVTYSARGYLMQVGFEMFKDRPFLGSGYGNFQPLTYAYQWRVSGSPFEYPRAGRSPHSAHVAILVGLGIVGFAIWIGIFVIYVSYVWRAWQTVRGGPSERLLIVQAIAVAAGLQFPYAAYGETHENKIFWLVLGLVIAIHQLASSTGTAQDRAPRWVPASLGT